MENDRMARSKTSTVRLIIVATAIAAAVVATMAASTTSSEIPQGGVATDGRPLGGDFVLIFFNGPSYGPENMLLLDTKTGRTWRRAGRELAAGWILLPRIDTAPNTVPKS